MDMILKINNVSYLLHSVLIPQWYEFYRLAETVEASCKDDSGLDYRQDLDFAVSSGTIRYVDPSTSQIALDREFGRPTVEIVMKASSRPSPGLTERRTIVRIPPKTNVQTRPSEVAIMTQPVWSVSVTTTKGGDCPGGTEKTEVAVEADMSTSEEQSNSGVPQR